MQKLTVALLAFTVALAVALPAGAQSRERRRTGEARLTLYELPNFQGRSVELYADAPNLADVGFNDRARSARVEGSWRLCEDRNYRSRCEPFADDVRDFAPFSFNAMVSSVQQVGGRPGRPGFEGPSMTRPVLGRDGVEGRSVVFFRRPSLNGTDVAANGQASADAYCRQVGLGAAVYFDASDRAREALGGDGRVYPNAPVLRDVLCRR